MSETIVFFGSGPVAAQSLKFLAKHFPIETVITKSVAAHHKEIAPVEEIARTNGLKVSFANDKNELDELISTQTLQSRLGIIVDYGVIVSAETISSFELGIVNSHFSLLPEWRGADPITFAILSGQHKTGVSLMLIEPSLDTGKLIAQKSLQVGNDETTPTLTNRLVKLSNELLIGYLPRYMGGEIKPKTQPHPDRATYSRKLTKADGIIDWNKPAEQLEREIRAYAGWPGSRTEIASKEVIISKAKVNNKTLSPGKILAENGHLIVGTSEKSLQIEFLKPAGKLEMSVQAFLAGYRDKL